MGEKFTAICFGLLMDLSVCNTLLTHYSKVADMEGDESIFKRVSVENSPRIFLCAPKL